MSDPRIPAGLFGHNGNLPESRGSVPDPLGWCVISTTALLTWLIGPACLAVLAAIGFVKYWRSWRSGRLDSKCLLGDIRVVLLYLFMLTIVGTVAAIVRFL